MGATGSSTLGDVENKGSQAVVRKILPLAASTSTSLKGKLVYQDGANGVKVAPTSQVFGDRTYFCSDDGTAVSLADAYVTCWKSNAIVIGKAEGAIVVDATCLASGTTAGSFASWATDVTSVTTATGAEAKKLAQYLGHAGEGLETGNPPTDAADGETTCKFRML